MSPIFAFSFSFFVLLYYRLCRYILPVYARGSVPSGTLTFAYICCNPCISKVPTDAKLVVKGVEGVGFNPHDTLPTPIEYDALTKLLPLICVVDG
jgi:hypothetical protein